MQQLQQPRSRSKHDARTFLAPGLLKSSPKDDEGACGKTLAECKESAPDPKKAFICLKNGGDCPFEFLS